MTEQELIKKYVGIPYKHLGRDPKEGLDCLGLLMCFFTDMGRDVKKYDYENYSEYWSVTDDRDYYIEKWPEEYVKVSVPHPLDVVLFQNSKGITNHAGIVLSNNRFIHSCKAGCVVAKLNDKQWYEKLTGFYRKIEND